MKTLVIVLNSSLISVTNVTSVIVETTKYILGMHFLIVLLVLRLGKKWHGKCENKCDTKQDRLFKSASYVSQCIYNMSQISSHILGL